MGEKEPQPREKDIPHAKVVQKKESKNGWIGLDSQGIWANVDICIPFLRLRFFFPLSKSNTISVTSPLLAGIGLSNDVVL